MADTYPRQLRVDWAAILAGVTVATAIGVILSTFGLGIGLSVNSPYEGEGIPPALFAIGAGLFVLAIQLLAFSIGAYVCARLRAPLTGFDEHSVDVSDGLHGIVVWALGVLAAGLISFVTLSGVTSAADTADRGSVIASAATAAQGEVDQAAARERTDNPEARDETLTERRAEIARKLTVISAFITASSLLAGAVVAFFAAGAGGRHRDENTRLNFFVLRRPLKEPVASPTRTVP